MKKAISLLTVISTFFSIGIPNVFAYDAEQIGNDHVPITVEVVVTDMETGISKNYVEIIEPHSQTKMTRNVTDSTVMSAGYDVLVELDDGVPKIVPRVDQGSSKTQGGIKASVNVTYEVSSNKEYIKVTKFSGSWTPTASIFYVTNRYVTIKDTLFGHSWEARPTSNSFSRTTGWGNVNHVRGDAGAWAYTECYGNVSDMAGTSKIVISFGFNGF